ncbi:hypothetical protein DESUT3_00850 [Desulfuromonas versatilis]|uniref:Type VI secretion system-associated protein TagF n=1 Tax=Desulfuromonas versatilis TaxID=2802975 RepID=A0ABM8HR09_9BACT|nr:type VI secretion system-associated protein TagF [Desulfuromonas versatilis]BCR03016.1 hypothetical protein DESUT3_00850 [Desulfuromonas versatilis]
MFGFFAKTTRAQAPRLPDQFGCFGKLPIHSDFIRHNLNAREMLGFEKWVQEGVGLITRKHSGGWPENYRNFSRFHFAQVGGDHERTLVGTLVASRDRSGRHYPFTVCAVAEDPLFREMQAVLPLVFGDFFRSAEGLCAEHWTSEPLGVLTSRVDCLGRRDTGLTRRHLLEGQIGLLEQATMGQFWAAALPGADAAARQQLFNTLFSALKTVVRRGPTRTNWGIRLPIPGEGDQRPAVVFWMQVIESILEDRSWRAHYFWCRGEAGRPAGLTVFFKSMPGSFLLQLLNPQLDDGSIFDTSRELARAAEIRCGGELERLLARDEVPMLEVLYKAGRREVLS